MSQERIELVEQGVVVSPCNTVGVLRQEDCEFKASPAYRTGPYLEKQKKQKCLVQSGQIGVWA